jgi:hypothetical protein
LPTCYRAKVTNGKSVTLCDAPLPIGILTGHNHQGWISPFHLKNLPLSAAVTEAITLRISSGACLRRYVCIRATHIGLHPNPDESDSQSSCL